MTTLEEEITRAVTLVGVKAGVEAKVIGAMCHEIRGIVRSLPTEVAPILAALRPLAMLGGPDDGITAAFHDLQDDVVVCMVGGQCITAGEVRAARKLVSVYVQPPACDCTIACNHPGNCGRRLCAFSPQNACSKCGAKEGEPCKGNCERKHMNKE